MMKKKKIIAAIQELQEDVADYLHYTARLARDMDLELELIAGSPVISVTQTPTALVGVGSLHPADVMQLKTIEDRKSTLNIVIDKLKEINKDIKLNIGLGTIENRVDQADEIDEAKLVVLDQSSSDNIFNQLFGTTETSISKGTDLPTLMLPGNIEYKKPKKLLCFIKDTPYEANTNMNEIVDLFDLDVTYAFEQDEDEHNIKEMMATIGVGFSDFEGELISYTSKSDTTDIDTLIKDNSADWIGILNYDRPLIERIYKKSTNSMILTSDLPLIIF